MVEVRPERPFDPSEVSVDDEGQHVLRTQLGIHFRRAATVADADALLERLGATISSSVRGVGTLVVRIPDPGNLEALGKAVAAIESDPSVWQVQTAIFRELRVLPENVTDGPGFPLVDHHLAVRAHAAWNASAAMREVPRLVVHDVFGSGPPTAIDAAVDAAQFGTSRASPVAVRGFVVVDDGGVARQPPPPAHHGYHVTGIALARFGGPDTPQGRATGMLPGLAQLDVADATLLAPLDGQMRMLQLAQAAPGTSVANVSLGWTGCAGRDTPFCQRRARMDASTWARAVRDAGLERRMLVVAAAGNIDREGIDAPVMALSSDLIAAAVRDDLVGEDGEAIPPLTNTLAVTGVRTRSNAAAGTWNVIECLADWSFTEGHVSAVGQDVYSLRAGAEAGTDSGTSMAAPQVAGLAAYLSAIRPDLDAQALRSVIVGTARPVPVTDAPGCSSAPAPPPVIDAYAALLALDHPGDAPVRAAILDVAGQDGRPGSDGRFDRLDLDLFMARFAEAPGRDPGFADLNGDGFTGGNGTRAFDLDLDGDASGSVDFTADGSTYTLQEARLTDERILCFYGYSDRYADDAGEPPESFLEACRLSPCDSSQALLVRTAADLEPLRGVTRLTFPLAIDSRELADLGALSELESSACRIQLRTTTLQGLEKLREVDGFFSLTDLSSSITSIAPLGRLEVVGGELSIGGFRSLTSLAGLESLRSVGALRLVGLEQLTSIAALSGLTEVVVAPGEEAGVNGAASVSIGQAPVLRDLTGLEGLRSIPGSFGLSATGVTSLDALSGLTHVGAGLAFASNPMTSLAGLSGVRTELPGRGVIWLTGNPALEDISALSGFTGTLTEIGVSDNPALRSLRGLEGLAGADRVYLERNERLQDLSGLAGLRELRTVKIGDHPALADVTGLAGVVGLRDVMLTRNPALTDISALRMTGVVNRISISATPVRGAPGMATVTDLGGLAVAGTELRDLRDFARVETLASLAILQNPSLVAIGMDALRSVRDDLQIVGNPMLPEDDAETFAASVQVGGRTVVQQNKP